jgi:choline dehydrogenase-like flavoprotein
MEKSIFMPEDYSKDVYHCEYLVIGTGAGGSVAGTLLAESGHDVIFLEEGGYYPATACNSNISEMTAKLYRYHGIFPFIGSPSIGFAEGCCVGGGTIINGGIISRTPSWVFEEWVSDHGLDEGTILRLNRYYEIIERDLNVMRHEIEKDDNLDSMKLLHASEQLGWKYEFVKRAVKECKNTNLCPTGCPSGAKQSMLETYLPRAIKNGARIFTRCRAMRIDYSGKKAKKVIARISGNKQKNIEILCKYIFLAGGAIQTPHLLQRSRISIPSGGKFQFHMNLKVVARFKDRLNAEKGTILTVQVREFDPDGLLIMASNLRPHYVATTLSHCDNSVINSLLEDYQYIAIFTAMIRSKSVACIISRFGDQPFVIYKFNPEDMKMIRFALQKMATLLFKAGAVELFMPIVGVGSVRSINELNEKLRLLKARRLKIVTVHIMSSCPMGIDSNTSVVNPDGRLWHMENVFVTDASVLPTNTGRNPQATIMAFAHEIVNRHLGK